MFNSKRCGSPGRNTAQEKPQRQEQIKSAKEGWDHLFLRGTSDLVSTLCTALCAGAAIAGQIIGK